MRELLAIALIFILIGASLMIGVSIIEMTYNITENITHGQSTTVLASVHTGVGTANTTFANFLPILAMAVVGGMALSFLGYYVLRSVLGGGGVM